MTVNKFAYLIAERIRVHQAPVSTNNNLHGGDENELRDIIYEKLALTGAASLPLLAANRSYVRCRGGV